MHAIYIHTYAHTLQEYGTPVYLAGIPYHSAASRALAVVSQYSAQRQVAASGGRSENIMCMYVLYIHM